jgi:hypothetical protein
VEKAALFLLFTGQKAKSIPFVAHVTAGVEGFLNLYLAESQKQDKQIDKNNMSGPGRRCGVKPALGGVRKFTTRMVAKLLKLPEGVRWQPREREFGSTHLIIILPEG